MRKTIKLSLVAAMAVAGLTTSASAVNLGESLKNVDMSGMVRYRHTATENAGNENEYQIELGVTTKIKNDFALDLAAEQTITETSGGTTTGDTTYTTTNAFFTYTGVENLDVKAGKQNYNLPLTDAAGASGLKAEIGVSGATVVLGAFTKGVKAGALVVPVGNATLTAMVGETGNTTATETDYTYLNATAEVAGVSLNLTKSEKDVKSDTTENEITSVVASTEVAGFGIDLGYATTGKNGAAVAMADGGDTAADFGLQELSSNDVSAEADITLVNISKEIYPALTVSLGQANLDYDLTTADQKETLFTAGYDINDQLSVSGWISNLETDGSADVQKSRVELKFTF